MIDVVTAPSQTSARLQKQQQPINPMKTNASPIRIRSLTTLLLAATVSLLTLSQPAQAGYVVTLQQVGFNVVATGSGAIDLTGLTFLGSGDSGGPALWPSFGRIITGPVEPPGMPDFPIPADFYIGFSGPTTFGAPEFAFGSSGSGDTVGIDGGNPQEMIPPSLLVPPGYVSGHALSSSSTFDNVTFSSFHLTSGATFEWTWGTGANQNFTLQIGAMPDAGSTLGLLLVAASGLFALGRFRSFLLA